MCVCVCTKRMLNPTGAMRRHDVAWMLILKDKKKKASLVLKRKETDSTEV